MLTETTHDCQHADTRYPVEIVRADDLAGLWASGEVVAIDAEWDWDRLPSGNARSKFLTSQYAWGVGSKPDVLAIWDPEYPHPKDCHFPGVKLLLANPEEVNPVKMGMAPAKTKINLAMFYSPKDVEVTIGKDNHRELLKNGVIHKSRKLNGKFSLEGVEYRLIDAIGTANSTLERFMESVGITSPVKSLSKGHDKSNMEAWIIDDPATFLDYAVGDVYYLKLALEKRTRQINQLVSDSLDFNPMYAYPWESGDRLPMSSGALVSDTFEKFLSRYYGEVIAHYGRKTKYASNKMQKVFQHGVDTGKVNLANLRSYPARFNTEGVEFFHPLSSTSIPAQGYFFSGENGSGLFNAVVYGGRCVNEYPERSVIRNVFDVDLNSCYGSALESLTFPIGTPRVLSYPSHVLKRITLGDFLRKHESELVPNLWTITVSGSLSFDQDLIASKLGVDELTIKRDLVKMDSPEDELTVDTEHLSGNMVHLYREIHLGCITTEILNTIRAVASKAELKEFMALQVVTAQWFARSEECPVGELPDLDKRPHAWVPVPLSEFIGKFLATRKEYKARAKSPDLTPQEKEDADNLQKGLKLFINTCYGVFASPYFRVGSALLANVITAKARTGAWMLAKSLGSVQSITDGGAYSNDGVRFITGNKLPGFHSLAKYDRSNSHRSIRVGRLYEDFEVGRALCYGDSNSQKAFEGHALNHVNTFWGNYGLSLPFTTEHKYEHTCDEMAYWGAANYLMLGVKPGTGKQSEHGEYVFKCRGTQDQTDGTPHLKEIEMWVRLNRIPPTELFVRDGKLVQPFGKKKSQIGVSEYVKTAVKFDVEGLLPGDEKVSLEPLRLNDNHVLMETATQWNNREREYSRDVRKHNTLISECLDHVPLFGAYKNNAVSKRGVIIKLYPELYTLL